MLNLLNLRRKRGETTNSVSTSNMIDWAVAFIHEANISANTSFTFANDTDGASITVIVRNTTGSNLNVTFPTVISTGLPATVAANRYNAYTFIKIKNNIFASFIEGML
jgi:hypothetical protein